jgi:hypothetical protein
MPRPVGHHPRRLDRQHGYGRNHLDLAFTSNVVSPNPQREETAGWRYARRRRPRNGFQRVAPSSHLDEWNVARCDHTLRAGRSVRVRQKEVPIHNTLLTSSPSNAEAGLALICTCLPAFVAQFRHLESAVRYGSSRRSQKTDLNDFTGEGDKADFTSSLTFGTSRSKGPTNGGASWSDEVQLVTNAQGRSTHDGDGDEVEESPHKGIMRKTEVTHVVTYAVEEEDRDSRGESR